MNIIDVIELCKANGWPADVVGRWVWVRFDSKPAPDVRAALKAAGFRWVHSRGQWAHNCGHPCRAGVGDPRFKYGAVPVGSFSVDELRPAGALA